MASDLGERPTTARVNELEAQLLSDGGPMGKLLVEHFRPAKPSKPAERRNRFQDDSNDNLNKAQREIKRLEAALSTLRQEKDASDHAARVEKEGLEEILAKEHAEVRRLQALLETGGKRDAAARAEAEQQSALGEAQEAARHAHQALKLSRAEVRAAEAATGAARERCRELEAEVSSIREAAVVEQSTLDRQQGLRNLLQGLQGSVDAWRERCRGWWVKETGVLSGEALRLQDTKLTPINPN